MEVQTQRKLFLSSELSVAAATAVRQSAAAAEADSQAKPAGGGGLLLDQARSVGHEFVYIYYSCVNKCPKDLHRFYSTGSHFIHGGRELPGQEPQLPAIGQVDIAARVEQLGLTDCRTKILMVDSLPAPADCVLIQVCGEISNNAGPMRRFMQTFLLAPVGPKKYFVQNDIFRFQDEVFTDADSGCHGNGGVVTDANGAANADAAAVAAPQPPRPLIDEVGAANSVSTVDAVEDHSVPVVNGNGREVDEVEQSAVEAERDSSPPVEKAKAVDAEQPPVDNKTEAADEQPNKRPDDAIAKPAKEEQNREQQQAPAGGKRNFAALFSGGGVGNGQQQQLPPSQPPQQQKQQQLKQAAPKRQVAAASSHPNGGDRDRDAPDNLQVFVGNLLPEVTETDLADAFRQCGEVTSCRISDGKPRPGASVVLNFGFITFASTAAVKMAVEKPPTVKGGQVNVEEKKPGGYRRGGGGGGRGGYRGGGGGGGGNYNNPYPRRERP